MTAGRSGAGPEGVGAGVAVGVADGVVDGVGPTVGLLWLASLVGDAVAGGTIDDWPVASGEGVTWPLPHAAATTSASAAGIDKSDRRREVRVGAAHRDRSPAGADRPLDYPPEWLAARYSCPIATAPGALVHQRRDP